MKIINYEQGTPEWMAARLGMPTASNFDKIITTTGEPSKQKEKYLWQLAGECVAGKAEETYQNANMLRGQEMENEARNLYQLFTNEEISKVGFCLADGDYKYGASPDSLVGKEGGLEIKCPLISTHVKYLLGGIFPMDYFQQIQGNLLVTGRKWWIFESYYPAIKPFIIKVERNEKFIKALKIELQMFCCELEEIIKKII